MSEPRGVDLLSLGWGREAVSGDPHFHDWQPEGSVIEADRRPSQPRASAPTLCPPVLILFDHGTPKGLARALSEHTVHTAQSKLGRPDQRRTVGRGRER
jgi:hypothetical protein